MLWSGRRVPGALLVVAVGLSSLVASPAEAAPPKPGARCSTQNEMDVARGRVYTCVRKGKKLVWNSGRAIPKSAPTATATPTPTASLPLMPPDPVQLTFSNVFEKRAFVQSNAWHSANSRYVAGTPKLGTIEVLTGPNSKPYYEDFVGAVAKVSRMLSKYEEPAQVLVIRYAAEDFSWASATLRSKLSVGDYRFMQDQHGEDPAGQNCPGDRSNCRGGYQQTGPSGVALTMLGIPNRGDSRTRIADYASGTLEIHEYFHAVQRVPMLRGGFGRNLEWPPAWFREGSATWIQYAALHAENFGDFKRSLDELASCRKTSNGGTLAKADLLEMLSSKEHEAVPSGWETWAQYCLGGQVIQILVAIAGVDSVMEVYEAAGQALGWERSFQRVYGLTWAEAVPVLAETVAALANGT